MVHPGMARSRLHPRMLYAPLRRQMKRKRFIKRRNGKVKLSKGLKSAVKAVINKGREKKVVDLLINNESQTPGNIGAPQALETGNWAGNNVFNDPDRDTWNVFPKIKQNQPTLVASQANPPVYTLQPSNGAVERLGNSIMPLAFSVRGNVYLDPRKPNSNTNYTGMTFKVMILSSKKYSDYDALAMVNGSGDNGYELTSNELLRADGNVQGYRGVYSTLESFRLNTPAIRVHASKTFVIKQSQLFNQFSSTPNIDGGSLPGIRRNFNFKVKLPKVVKYGDNSDTTPEGISPFLVCIYNYHNGNDASVAPQVDTTPPRIYWSSRLTYTDA